MSMPRTRGWPPSPARSAKCCCAPPCWAATPCRSVPAALSPGNPERHPRSIPSFAPTVFRTLKGGVHPMSAPVPRPGILDIDPYVGGESHAPGVDRLIRLASNEGALGPSPRAVAAYQEAAAELHRYPDGGAVRLREAIGRVYSLDPARIVCGTGSDELLGLLAKSYAGPGDEVLYSAHGFLMYPIAAKTVGATPVAAPEKHLRSDVDALLERVTERTRILFLANPNNPT